MSEYCLVSSSTLLSDRRSDYGLLLMSFLFAELAFSQVQFYSSPSGICRMRARLESPFSSQRVVLPALSQGC